MGVRRKCTGNSRGSKLIVDLIDLSRMPLIHGGREAWSGRIPVKSGGRHTTVRYHIWFRRGCRAGKRTSRDMSLPFVQKLQIQCG